jgi:hypothetical protein
MQRLPELIDVVTLPGIDPRVVRLHTSAGSPIAHQQHRDDRRRTSPGSGCGWPDMASLSENADG